MCAKDVTLNLNASINVMVSGVLFCLCSLLHLAINRKSSGLEDLRFRTTSGIQMSRRGRDSKDSGPEVGVVG